MRRRLVPVALLLLLVPAAEGLAQPPEPSSPAASSGLGGRRDVVGPGVRDLQAERQRDRGVAPAPHHEERQLRDLNALSRRLAPRVPPPAPEVEARR